MQPHGKELIVDNTHDATVVLGVVAAALVGTRKPSPELAVAATLSRRFTPHVFLGEPLTFPQRLDPEATRVLGTLCAMAAEKVATVTPLIEVFAGNSALARMRVLKQMAKHEDLQPALVVATNTPAVEELTAVLEPMGVLPQRATPPQET